MQKLPLASILLTNYLNDAKIAQDIIDTKLGELKGSVVFENMKIEFLEQYVIEKTRFIEVVEKTDTKCVFKNSGVTLSLYAQGDNCEVEMSLYGADSRDALNRVLFNNLYSFGDISFGDIDFESQTLDQCIFSVDENDDFVKEFVDDYVAFMYNQEFRKEDEWLIVSFGFVECAIKNYTFKFTY